MEHKNLHDLAFDRSHKYTQKSPQSPKAHDYRKPKFLSKQSLA